MQLYGPLNLDSTSLPVATSIDIKSKEENEDSCQVEKIHCPCGNSLPTDSMIKCEDHRCNAWQHMACVLIPEKPTEGILPNPPEIFYCELCRLSRADPFWVTIAHPLKPVKLNITNMPTDGSSPTLSIEKTFQITRADRDLLSKQEYDVQAWCMLLNDKVTFRMQWPQYAELQINGVPVRAINRPASQLLGANGRDDGPIITACTRDGINKIYLGGCDARIFCLGVRIVKRRTLHQNPTMRLSKTEVNLRRLLAAAPQQQNQTKLVHYVATLREQLEQLGEERNPDGLPRVSKAQLNDYSEKIEALAANLVTTECQDDAELPGELSLETKVSESSPPISDGEGVYSPRGLRRRFVCRPQSDNRHSTNVEDSNTSQPVKLDSAAQTHIEKHRKLQEDLTDEMVVLARQLKESSLMMSQSVRSTEKILDSTEKAVERSLASTGHANTRAMEVYSQSVKTSCLTWLLMFAMTCVFIMVVLLIRVT